MSSCIVPREATMLYRRLPRFAYNWRWITVIALITMGNAGDSLALDVRCAIVPASDSNEDLAPLIDSLEAILSKSENLSVLSRTEMDRLLAERSISLEHGRRPRGDYQTFGTLLRADLLVFLYGRRMDKKGVLLEFEVVETKHGIRLLAEELAWKDHPLSIAEALTERIIAAKERLDSPIKYVFAAPSFECTDLLFAPAAQGSAFAKIARRTIEKADSAVVVDLEHASDLAAELSFTNGSDRIKRALPYYIIGQYHHTGSRDARRVEMDLTLRHGQTVVRKDKIPSLSLDVAGRKITSVVERMLVESIDVKVEASDSAQTQREANLLAKRARELASFDDWVRAIDLAESALLLEPTRWHLHLLIAKWCERFVRIDGRKLCQNLKNTPVPSSTRPSDFFLNPERKRRYALLALDHLRRYVVHKPLDHDLVNTIQNIFSTTRILNYDWEKDVCDFRKRQRIVIKEKLDLYLRILSENESRLRDPHDGFLINSIAAVGDMIASRWSPYSVEERLDVLHRALIGFSHFKYGYDAQCRLLRAFPYTLGNDYVHWLSLCINQLTNANDAQSKLTVDILRTILDVSDVADEETAKRKIDDLLTKVYPGEDVADLPRYSIHGLLVRRLQELGKVYPYTPQYNPVQDNFCVDKEGVLTSIEFKTTDGIPVPSFRDIAIRGSIFRCGKSMDIIHAGNHLYAMEKPGTLKPIPPPRGEQWRFIGSVVSDGRYIWIADLNLQNPIVVIDIDTLEIVASFGPEQGLPPVTPSGMGRCHVKIALIGQGQACVVGTFGRTWIATLTFDPDRPIGSREIVDVFHEARQNSFDRMMNFKQRSNLDQSFHPRFAYAVETEQPSHHLVLIGRLLMGACTTFVDDVIVADPRNRTVQLLPLNGSAMSLVVSDNQRLIRIIPTFSSERINFLQVLRPPEFTQTPPVPLGPPGYSMTVVAEFVLDDDTIYILQNHELATIDLAERKIVRHCGLTKKQSGFVARLAHSSQYGLILYSDVGIWQVKLPKSSSKP